jgi:hypothetical protein
MMEAVVKESRAGCSSASARRSSVELLYQVFRRFLVTLPMVEIVRPFPAAMTVYFNPVAIPLAGKSLTVCLQVFADPSASSSLLDAKIAYPGERARKRDLRDEMDGDETEDLTVLDGDHQLGIRVAIQLHDLLPDEPLGPGISQLSKQIGYSIGVCRRCLSDLHLVVPFPDRSFDRA